MYNYDSVRILIISNFSGKVEKIRTQFFYQKFFYLAIYEIMWKIMIEPDRPQIIM